MKLLDAIKLTGKRVEIPDCGRDDLPQFFKDMGYKRGVEIGVYKGDYTVKLCESGMEIMGIDPWVAYGDFSRGENKAQDRQDFLYQHALGVTSKYPKCKLIRKTSMDAVKDFELESIDWVYIDGNHGFKYVAEDLWEWTKRVRKGGVVSGHDYALTKDANDKYSYHVKYAVDGFTEAKGIKDWYVLGRRETIKGESRDDCRSWMFIRK